MMRKFCISITSLLIPFYIIASDVQGTIIDSEKNPVDGAYILLLQSGYHTHTDEFGKFIIQNAEEGDSKRVEGEASEADRGTQQVCGAGDE